MLRTTCKKALDGIRSFILENTITDNYEEFKKTETFNDAAKIIIKVFYDEYMHGYNWNRNRQDCFIDWIAGMPSVFNSDFIFADNAKKILADILEETETEQAKYSDCDAWKFLANLIYREVTKATGKYF